MDTRTPLADRPRPALRACDGSPWPSDDDLDVEAEWAHWLQSHAALPMTDAESMAGDAPFIDPISLDPTSLDPTSFDPSLAGGAADRASIDADAAAKSDLDARLGHLELTVVARHRAAAEEGRVIAAILRDAAADPTPWVGPDPTLDLAWNDARGRTVAAVRRDRADLAERAAVAEIAVPLHLAEQTVRTRAAQVEVLQQRCPVLWRQFTAGRTSDRHAADAARLAASLPDDDPISWAAFDAGAAQIAPTLVPTKFAVAARALRERVHAESLEVRHRRAARDRGVWMTPELDGMASLSALLPADRARSIMSRLDRAARHLHAAPDEERTLAQLRADVLADLVTSPPAEPRDAAEPPAEPRDAAEPPAEPRDAVEPPAESREAAEPPVQIPTSADIAADATSSPPPHARSPQKTPAPTAAEPGVTPAPPPRVPLPRADSGSPTGANPHTHSASTPLPTNTRRRRPVSPTGPTVVISIPALTLLGAGDEAATLEGYGPIDLDTASRLAGEASSWVRLLTHPVTGAPLILDRQTYRVPAALRRWLGVTSPTCVFPGCNRAARDCDLDHLTAWADGGTTDADNLEPECRHHHRLRHETGWSPSHDPETGDLRWTSPLGATYEADPPPF
jgi:hypothetical protein